MADNPPQFGQNLPPNEGNAGNQAQLQPCLRHVGRLTALRCQRCDRYMCPDCARCATVGMQCVDCMLAASNSTQPLGVSVPRRYTGSFLSKFAGGIMADAPVTAALVAICVVAYLLQWIFPLLTSYGSFQLLAAQVEPWRFVTAGFLHGSFLHLLMNMMVLTVVGSPIERALGARRYLWIYLLSVVGGGVAYALWFMIDQQSAFTVSLGASGAGFGLFAAVFVMQRRVGADMRSISALLVVNLVFTFMFPGIAWQAHIGGLITGGLVTGAFMTVASYVKKVRQQVFQARGAAAAHAAARRSERILDALVGLGCLAVLVLLCLPAYGFNWPIELASYWFGA